MPTYRCLGRSLPRRLFDPISYTLPHILHTAPHPTQRGQALDLLLSLLLANLSLVATSVLQPHTHRQTLSGPSLRQQRATSTPKAILGCCFYVPLPATHQQLCLTAWVQSQPPLTRL